MTGKDPALYFILGFAVGSFAVAEVVMMALVLRSYRNARAHVQEIIWGAIPALILLFFLIQSFQIDLSVIHYLAKK